MLSDDEVDPGEFSLQYIFSESDVMRMIVGMIEEKPTSDLNGYGVQSSHMDTPTDNVEHGVKEVRSTSSEVSVNQESRPALEQSADYLQHEMRGVTLNTHLSQLSECRISQNCFS